MAREPKTRAKPTTTTAANRNGDGSGTNAPKKTRKSGGDRPSTYTEALGQEICRRLVNGERLDQICQSPHMPKARETIWRWRKDNPAFNADYLEARADQADVIADEILQIAETEQDIQRGRLKIEARRAVLHRLTRTYGAASPQPESKPFDLAGAIREGRERLDALIKEVGHERAQRIKEDESIEQARNPNPRHGEELIRANQRYAMHLLEQRKKALLALETLEKPENPI